MGDNRTANFAELNAGIYAGIMCGVAFGAVLADYVGYKTVLLVSAAMALFAAMFPAMLGEMKEESRLISQGEKIKLTSADIGTFALFLLVVVIPTCIADAFNGFLLPLYVNELGLPSAYVGRVTLVYNLCLVYLSSTILLKAVVRYVKNPLYQNILHMVVISAALFAAAYIGGFIAVIIAGALLGAVDGFGFSVQNSYILDTKVAVRFGAARVLTWFSLFKKFCAVLAPFVFGLFIMNGFGGLGLMAGMFILCALLGATIIPLWEKRVNNS